MTDTEKWRELYRRLDEVQHACGQRPWTDVSRAEFNVLGLVIDWMRKMDTGHYQQSLIEAGY